MTAFSPAGFRLLFHKFPNTTGLARNIAAIDRNLLRDEYRELKARAPRRAECGKQWFVLGHDGRLANGVRSALREKHVARALWNCKGAWSLPSGGRFRLLDYEFSLHAHQSDGAGEVDLLAATDKGRLIVIEMKFAPRSDTPLGALMQGIRYAAIVEANLPVIAAEAKARFGVKIAAQRPIVQVLAPKAWWLGWFELKTSTRCAAGNWETALAGFAADVRSRLELPVEFAALDDIAGFVGPDPKQPRLSPAPALYPVRPGEQPSFGPALPWRPDAARP